MFEVVSGRVWVLLSVPTEFPHSVNGPFFDLEQIFPPLTKGLPLLQERGLPFSFNWHLFFPEEPFLFLTDGRFEYMDRMVIIW